MTIMRTTAGTLSAATDQQAYPTSALVTTTTTSTTEQPRPTVALIHTILTAVKNSGATAETIADAELLLQRGSIFEVALEASEEFGDLRDVLEMFDLIAQRVARHESLKPWVNAVEADRAQQAKATVVFTVTCGDHRPGRLDSDDDLDMLHCALNAHHAGDHADALARTWPRAEARA
jgi:hypothetical protein